MAAAEAGKSGDVQKKEAGELLLLHVADRIIVPVKGVVVLIPVEREEVANRRSMH